MNYSYPTLNLDLVLMMFVTSCGAERVDEDYKAVKAHEVWKTGSSVQEELCSSASIEGEHLVFADNIRSLLFKRGHPQVYGRLLHQSCGSSLTLSVPDVVGYF